MMYSATELFDKLKEIENLIREKTNPDGSLSFDPYPVIVSLELSRRMVLKEATREEKSE